MMPVFPTPAFRFDARAALSRLMSSPVLLRPKVPFWAKVLTVASLLSVVPWVVVFGSSQVIGVLISTVLLVVSVGLLVTDPKLGFYFAFASRSVIDVFYDTPLIGNLNSQRILGALFPLVFFGIAVSREKRLTQMPLAVPLLTMIAFSLLGVITVTDRLDFIAEWLRTSGGWLLFFAVPIFVKNRKDVHDFLMVAMVPLALPIVGALLQQVGVIPFNEFGGVGESGRATAFYYHPWDLLRYLLSGLIIAFYFWQIKAKPRWFFLGYMAIILLCCYLTYLRFAFVGIAVVIVLWLIYTRRFVSLVVSGAAGIAFVTSREGFFVKFFDDVPKFFDPAHQSEAFSGRVFLVENAQAFFAGLDLKAKWLGQWADGYNRFVHDDWLRVLVDWGYLGAAFYVLMLGMALVYLLRCATRYRKLDRMMWSLVVAELCFLMLYILSSFTARPSQYPSFNWYFWAIMGIIASEPWREAKLLRSLRQTSDPASVFPSHPSVTAPSSRRVVIPVPTGTLG